MRLMDMKLELVAVPVTDVDRANTFYVDPDGNKWAAQQIIPQEGQ